MSNSDNLIAALCNPSFYEHETKSISVIETHISWVLITGTFAYKIKKPIKFSFVDFSSLEKRHFYCQEELRLNSRLAPEIYLGVVAITGTHQKPSFNKSSRPIEYAVKMNQFSQNMLLSFLSTHSKLLQQHIDAMATQIAEFHMHIEKTDTKSNFGVPEDIRHWVTDNYNQIESNLESGYDQTLLTKIKAWSEKTFNKKITLLQQRKAHGFVRECHGDMHLGNMVLLNGKVTIFDGIDFNEHLRWIDVMSEIAFVVMDLQNRGHIQFANRLLNLYLQLTGDYEGLNVFSYYLVYRAMVRAKVALLRISQKTLSSMEEKKIQTEFDSYIELASTYIKQGKRALIITHGLSGSGKSTYTETLLESIRAIRIRSDVERKRLYGYKQSEHTYSKINEGIYTAQSSSATYKKLASLAKSILDSGYSVIVDACFLQHEQRETFHVLAQELKIPFIILSFQASEDILKERIINRSKNLSEAGIEVLNAQLSHYVPLVKKEDNNTIVINTEEHIQESEIAKAVVNRM